tara:strand:+ start:34520 stop:35005 length:486 start_codon:yes stop_codon:yes gene_type:complete
VVDYEEAIFIQGRVYKLRCEHCSEMFSLMGVSAENDTQHMDVMTAGQRGGQGVVVYKTTGPEFGSIVRGRPVEVPQRILDIVECDDYHTSRIVRTEDQNDDLRGLSRSEYLKKARPPKLFWKCPFCETGEAVSIAEMKPGEFKKQGGKLTVIHPLYLGMEW